MKVVGIGLNKTGTKTLQSFFVQWGFRNRTYDLDAFERYRRGDIEGLLDEMEDFDSFEDWPWPLFYRDIDERFPDARFILTRRRDADRWYRSLCNMAIRRGPFTDFEQHIYGYAMPQGHRAEHIAFYEDHNREVREYFADRPGKLLEVCWEEGSTGDDVADFLGQPRPEAPDGHVNRSSRRGVYEGDNLLVAQANRVLYQSARTAKRRLRSLGS